MMPHSQEYPWLASYPDGIRWDAVIAPKPLYALLDDAVAKWPERVALDFFGKTYTYARLHEMVTRIARGLQDIGVGKETRVGLFMPNSPQYVMCYYAILKLGGTVVNFNPLYSIKEVEHQIRDSNVEVMVTLNLKPLYNKLKPLLGVTSLRHIVMGVFQEAMPMSKAALFTMAKARDLMVPHKDEQHTTINHLLSYPAEVTSPHILPNEHFAVLQYTGGTTGVPKGAILTHANLYVNAMQSLMWKKGLVPGGETMLAVLPFFHVFAMTVALNLAIANGMTIIIHPRFDIKHVLEDIHEKKPTLLPGVSTLYATINNYRKLDKYDLSSLKACISGGGPLPLEVKERFEQLTGCSLVEGYGLTESSPVTHCQPLFGRQKKGSIGLPLPGTISEVLDPEDKRSILPVGKVGEITIRGPQVMKGYLNQPEETAKVLINGRLHTGDLGYMDEDGYFYIVDRLKEMIIVGGYNVYPRNVEEAMYTHPAIAEAAVVGLDHPRRGQMIKAYAVLKDGHKLAEDELKEYLRARMSAYAVPHKVEFRAELPKSAIGKILKKELVAQEKAKGHADDEA